MNMRSLVCIVLALAILETSTGQIDSARRTYPNVANLAAPKLSQDSMNNILISFYRKWKCKFIKHFEGSDQSYTLVVDDRHKKEACVSESQGYGMMIVALMGRIDPSVRLLYDSLYRFYIAHPTNKNAGNWDGNSLMAEGIGKNGSYTDRSSATDGDIDIAFSLLIANENWGKVDTINYLKSAINLINCIMKFEVNHDTWTLFMSNDERVEGRRYSNKYFGTRSSDFMPAYFRIFSKVTGNRDWEKVISKEYAIFQKMQARGAGLVPDFIVDVNGDPKPAPPHYEENKTDGDYSINACRVPFRIALDYLWKPDTDKSPAEVIEKFNYFIEHASQGSADSIFVDYQLTGKPLKGDNEMYYIAPFGVAAMCDPANPEWLNTLWRFIIDPPKDFIHSHRKSRDYFGETIRIYSLFILTGNLYAPKV